jgi:hypothetical protein
MGRIRVLRQPFALLLRPAPAPGTTLAGLPVAFALAGAEADERAVPLAIFTADPDLTTTRPGQALPGGKNYPGTATSSPAPAPQPSWSPRPAGPPLGYHAPRPAGQERPLARNTGWPLAAVPAGDDRPSVAAAGQRRPCDVP